LFGHFLSWLNDHETDVFTIATGNDISKLPLEFSRSERFDGVCFLDLPGAAQKQLIWQLYLDMFDLNRQQAKPSVKDWTGAEIRSCCRLAALLDVSLVEAANSFGAQGNFLSAGKKLLDTTHPKFRAITTVKNKAVNFWKSLTLSYPEPGIRLIRQDKIDLFDAQMREFREELNGAVAALEERYHHLKAAAQRRLGTL